MYGQNGYSTFNWDNKCDFLVIVAPARSLRTGLGSIVKSAKMQLSSVLALYSGAINHLFVIYTVHSIKLMNALNRNMISLPKFQFHCLVQRHLSWFNVRPHTARIVRDHLQVSQIPRMEWPACSPDLNPIEQLWNQLGKAIRVRRILLEQWDAIPQIIRLIRSMRRCQAPIAW